MMARQITLKCAPAAMLALALSGCYTVGPKYARPTAPTAPAYKESQAGDATAQAEGWKQANPQDAMLRGKWWEIFGDEELNGLEEKLNINNQNIAQFFANYEAARTQVASARANQWPTVTIGASGSRRRQPAMQSSTTAKGIASTQNSLQLPINVSWEPDLFGAVRNQISQAAAGAQVSAAQLENEKLSEQASLAQYYFELRGQDSLQQLYDQTIAEYKAALELTQSLFKLGMNSQEDVDQAETALRTAEANVVQVGTTRAQYEHAIALLVGEPASAFSLPVKSLAFKAPEIPTGLPSQLLERRPDIAAAERTIAEQNARIGVAKAAYYPNVSISLGGGLQSSFWSNLLKWNNRYWSLGPSVSETVFDGGARKATLAMDKAQYDASVAAYRQTVLTALKEVEDSLVDNRQIAEQIGRERLAIDASTRYDQIAKARYKTGLDTYLNVITAETSLLNSQLQLVQLETQQATSAVQLVTALGGGWDTSQLPTDAQVKQK